MKFVYKIICAIRGKHKIHYATEACKCGYTRKSEELDLHSDKYYLKSK